MITAFIVLLEYYLVYLFMKSMLTSKTLNSLRNQKKTYPILFFV
jgi:hypothetical protein